MPNHANSHSPVSSGALAELLTLGPSVAVPSSNAKAGVRYLLNSHATGHMPPLYGFGYAVYAVRTWYGVFA